MAVSYQVVRFAKSTGGNGTTQDVNLTFTPKAILVFSEGNTANNTVSAEYNFSWGFSDGTNHAAMAAAGDDAATVSESGRILRNDAVYVRLNNSTPRTTTDCYGSVAFATNKVTFTWTLNDAVASLITVVAFGGTDITNVKVNTVSAGGTNTAPEDIDYTGLGFTPTSGNAALFLMSVGLSVNNTNSTTALPFFGAAVSSSKRWAVGNCPENNVDPTDTHRLHISTRCLRGVGIDGALGAPDYDFVSWISDGFRLSSNTAIATNIQQAYMVINGGTWDCGSLQSPTSPTNNVDYTASVSSNTLRGLIFAGTATSSNGTSTADSVITVGATDGTNHSCIGTISEDNQGTEDDYRVNDTINVIRPLTTNGAALDVATFDSFTTNNFRLDWGTADATARYYGWIAVADGTGLTQVSTTTTHKYNIIGKITRTRTHKYNIIAQISRTRTHKYNIIQKITATKTHKFNIIAKVTESNTHKYNIIAKLTASRTHKFSILNTVSRTRTHKYNILEKITKSAVHVYNVIGKVTESNTHKYNIIAKLTTTKTHLYNILQGVSTTKTHEYNIIGKITKTTTHKYNIIQKITETNSHKYNIIGKVVATKTHLYNVIGKITQSTTHKYNITGTVSTSTTHKYNIISAVATKTTTHKYNIESDSVVTKNTTHKYNLLERVTTTKTHLYNIVEQVSTIKTHVFSVIAQVVSQKTHKYNIIQKITPQRTHAFSILNAVSTTKTHIYNILEAIDTTTTHKYNIIARLTVTKTHKYDVESSISRVEKTTTHLYDVQAATTPISVEKTHLFDVLAKITTIKTHRWAIIAKITKSVTHKYDIISSIGKSAIHKYNIIGKLSVLRTHIFNIVNAIETTTKTHKYNILNSVGPLTITHKYNVIGKVTKTTTYKYAMGGRVSKTSTHRYQLGAIIFRELGGSTHARIRFPERVQIIDILGDINNRAYADIEVSTIHQPSNRAIGFVQIVLDGQNQANHTIHNLLTASSNPRIVVRSGLILPEVIDSIENQAVCQYIGIQSLEPHPQPRLQLRCSLRLQHSQKIHLQTKGETQIAQTEKTIIKVSALTQIKQNDKVINTASIMIPANLNLNKIIIPEIMSLRREKTLKTIIKLLKTEDLFG